MRASIMTADELTIRLIDGLVLFWVVLWFTIGTWSGVTIWQLADIGDTISNSGGALKTAGTALVNIGSLPVVGERAGGLGSQVVTTSVDVSSRGQEIKGELHQLSLLLGLSIMLMPTTPVVGLYLPLRLARRRELTDLRRALADHRDDPLLDRYLAARALANLSFTEVRSLSTDPWREIYDGEPGSLADAELDRLGLLRPEH